MTKLICTGKALCQIVIAAKPRRAASFAAFELQYNLAKITDVKLNIVSSDNRDEHLFPIFVGLSPGTESLGCKNDDFSPQEYMIKHVDDALILMGRDKDDFEKCDYADVNTFPADFDLQATAYAAYDFLESFCGVRWYLPTELGLHYDKRDTLEIPACNICRKPAFEYRTEKYYGVQRTPTMPPWRIYYPADLCGDGPFSKWDPIDAREQEIFRRRHRLGGRGFCADHSFYGYYDRFLKKHPDWFAQGYENDANHKDKPPQLCYSNPEVIAQVVQDARDYFDKKIKRPGAVALEDCFSILPMDNHDFCKCKKCAELIEEYPVAGKGEFTSGICSDYIFNFFSKVAAEVYKSHPDKSLSAIAYSKYAFPPKKKINIPPNLIVALCIHARTFREKVRRNDNLLLDKWHQSYPDLKKQVWLYYCFPSYCGIYYNYYPFPGFFAHHIPEFMGNYHAKNVCGVFYESSYLAGIKLAEHDNGMLKSPLLDQLEFLITWKLADKPETDANKYIDEFFANYYGNAADSMRKFYSLVEDRYCAEGQTFYEGKHQCPEHAWKDLGTDEVMAKLSGYMTDAKQQQLKEIERRRLEVFEKGIWMPMLKGKKMYFDSIRAEGKDHS